jgi:hypothetical protein
VSEAPTHSFYQDTIPADGPGRCDYTYGDGSRCGLRPDQHPQAEQLQARIAELEQALRDWWAHENTMDGPPWHETRGRILDLLPDLEPQ